MIFFQRLIIIVTILFSAPTFAQIADMPTTKNFKVGDTWQWVQIDVRTKNEESQRSSTVVEEEGILKLKSKDGISSQISSRFIGNSGQSKPWRIWPLEVGKE